MDKPYHKYTEKRYYCDMGRKGGLISKLVIFFFVFVFSVSIAAGLNFYANQKNLYMEQCGYRLHGQTSPYDFNGDYYLAEKNTLKFVFYSCVI